MSHEHDMPIVERLTALLLPLGLDIVHAFPAQVYNAACPADRPPLPTYGRRDSTLAVLVGNSAALWPALLSSLAAAPARLAAPDPLDEYVQRAVRAAAADAFGGACSDDDDDVAAAAAATPSSPPPPLRWHVRFSTETGGRFADMLGAARASGLAYYSDATHLCALNSALTSPCARCSSSTRRLQ
jgi:hypothetical protein